MEPQNRYYRHAKISAAKFRSVLRYFALDLTVSDTARLTGLSIRATNTLYLKLRRYLHTQALAEALQELVSGAVELDESYFGPRRVWGKRGHGVGSKTIVFGLFKRGGQVYTENLPDCSKKTALNFLTLTEYLTAHTL